MVFPLSKVGSEPTSKSKAENEKYGEADILGCSFNFEDFQVSPKCLKIYENASQLNFSISDHDAETFENYHCLQ